MINALAIFGAVYILVFVLKGICKLDNGKRAIKVLNKILTIITVGWMGASLGSFCIGIGYAGQQCRGLTIQDQDLELQD